VRHFSSTKATAAKVRATFKEPFPSMPPSGT
jgi:hypothetical protein